MPRHQLIGMFPPRERLDALAPGVDRRVILADVEAELLGRVVKVARKRDVRDGRPIPEQEFAALEPLIDNAEVAVDAPLEEGEHAGIATGLRKVFQEAIGAEKAVDLLIIEDD